MPRGPWGSDPPPRKSGKPDFPDFEEYIASAQERLRARFSGGNFAGRTPSIIVLAGVAIWAGRSPVCSASRSTSGALSWTRNKFVAKVTPSATLSLLRPSIAIESFLTSTGPFRPMTRVSHRKARECCLVPILNSSNTLEAKQGSLKTAGCRSSQVGVTVVQKVSGPRSGAHFGMPAIGRLVISGVAKPEATNRSPKRSGSPANRAFHLMNAAQNLSAARTKSAITSGYTV